MVGEKRPRIAGCFGGGHEISEAIYHIIAVCVVPEYWAAFDPANHYVMNYPWGI